MAGHRIAFAVLAAATVAAPASAQTPRPPPSVAQKISVMDTACGAAGGRPGGGAYIFVYDFSGDGVTDYLVSEGNYNCIGRPDAFRPGGRAVVEIYVTEGADAPRGFYEVVRGYRILDGRPRVVQLVREGSACGINAAGACTVSLRWDAGARRFAGGPLGANASVAPAPPSAVRASAPPLRAPGTPLPRAVQAPAPSAPGATGPGVLSAAEIRSQIVGHRVEAEDGAMTWYYYANGKYDGDDGRNARGGTYAVRADGRLCWTENSGISGCFQYYRQGGKLQVRRADPDNKFEVGPVKVGPL